MDGAEEVLLHDSPAYLLRCAHQSAVGIFLTECAAFDLTPPQFAALVALGANGAMEQVSLGGAAALDRTTVAVVLKNLGKRGFVTISTSPTDRRAKQASLTESGRAFLREAEKTTDKIHQKILAPLTPREQKQFMKLLAKLADGNNRFSRAPFKRAAPPQA